VKSVREITIDKDTGNCSGPTWGCGRPKAREYYDSRGAQRERAQSRQCTLEESQRAEGDRMTGIFTIILMFSTVAALKSLFLLEFEGILLGAQTMCYRNLLPGHLSLVLLTSEATLAAAAR
jgi:hypothetical protein